MDKKKVVVDLDGVLFQLTETIVDKLKVEYPNLSMNSIITYDFNKSLLKLPVEDAVKHLDVEIAEKIVREDFDATLGVPRNILLEQYSRIEYYKSAPVYEDSCKALIKLFDSGKYNIVFNSSAFGEFSSNIAWNKSLRLKDLFEEYIYGVIISENVKKPTILDADIVIDDCLEVLYDYIKVGSNAKLFLVDQPYNRLAVTKEDKEVLEKVTRISSIADVEAILREQV